MTNAEARFNNSLRPRKPEGSLGRTAQDGHLDSHTAPELWKTLALFLKAYIAVTTLSDDAHERLSLVPPFSYTPGGYGAKAHQIPFAYVITVSYRDLTDSPHQTLCKSLAA